MKAIIVRFHEIPEGMTEQDARILINDALGEFAVARSSPGDYVAKRYTQDVYPDGPARDAKVEEVRKRVSWARTMVDNKSVRIEDAYCCGYCGSPDLPRDDLWDDQDYPRCPDCHGC